MYFAGLENNDGKGDYPFADDCDRMENGVHTTNNPTLSPNAAFNAFGMSCMAQFKSGYYAVVTRIHHRRFPIVDEQRGIVWAYVIFDQNGTVHTIKLTNGQTVSMGNIFNRPSSLEVTEAFKITDGKNSSHRDGRLRIAVPSEFRMGWHQRQIMTRPGRNHGHDEIFSRCRRSGSRHCGLSRGGWSGARAATGGSPGTRRRRQAANLGGRRRHGNRHRHIPDSLHGLPRQPQCPASSLARRDPPDASRANLRRADHRLDEAARRPADRRSAKNARHLPQRPAPRQLERRRRQGHAESLRVESAAEGSFYRSGLEWLEP